jgi:Mrp family chromosome partitioning ATPase
VSDPFAGLVSPTAEPTVSDPFDAPVAVSDPFLAPAAADSAVTDPFAEVLGTAPSAPAQDFLTPSVETPAFKDAPDTSFDAFISGAAPSVPAPVTAAPAVLDPFSADGVTGDDTATTVATPAAEPEAVFDLPMPEVPTDDGADKQSLMQRMRARRAEAAVAEVVASPAEPTPYELPTPNQTFEPAPAPVPADLPVPAQPVVHAPIAVPTPAVSGDGLKLAPRPVSADVDFFAGTGISSGGSQVVFSVAGKGGAGKTTNSLFYAQTAGGGGVKTLVIDANRDQGDIGTSLRIDKVGFPTILEALRSGPEGAVVTKTAINNARPNAAQDITFDVVLAPPRDFAGPKYASAELYAQVLAWAKPRYDLIVIDTQIIEAHKSDLHTGFVIPELRSGAWSAGIALYDYSAIRNAFSVFEELSALGVTATRSLIVATRWPERDSDTDKFNSQFGQYGTFLGFVGDDPNINAQKSVGNLLVASPAIEPVVRALLYRVTGNSVFAPIEDTGKKRGKQAPAPAAADSAQGKKRFGLFGRSK